MRCMEGLLLMAAATPVAVSAEGEPIGSAPVSFTSVQAPHAKKFKKNDLVTIIVQEDSAYTSNAQSQSQKQQDFDLAFEQLKMQLATTQNGALTATSVGSSGDVARRRSSSRRTDNNRQNQGVTQDRTDSLSLRIAAIVVDVEAERDDGAGGRGRDIIVDREVQHYHMSGICRADDVTPDNTLLSSRSWRNLTMNKQTSGGSEGWGGRAVG